MKEIRKYSMDQVRVINDYSNPDNETFDQDYMYTDDTSLGGFWQSQRTLPKEVSYRAPLADGIHLSVGLADISISSQSFEDYRSKSTTVIYMSAQEKNDEQVATTLAKGKALSCGLYVSLIDLNDLPDEVAALLEKFPKKIDFKATSNVSALVVDKLCCPIPDWYQGDARRLIAEAKAHELLAIVVAAFSNPVIRQKANVKHAMAARDIIETDLMNTPNLQTLAKQTGLNVRSLTQVFKEVFGISINQYITERRMEMAVCLLESGLSVSETAYKVGYSLPYFSELFQKRFAVVAGEIRKGHLLPKT